MFTTIADKTVPETLVLDDGRQRDEATLLGSSMRGWIYRSTSPNVWYRLIPIEDSSLEWRHRIRADAPVEDCFLSATADWHQPFSDAPRLVVLYRSLTPARSLAECLKDHDVSVRLKSAIALLRMVSQCWSTLSPLMPMPADIVVDENGMARLLWIPKGSLPNERTVFEDPQRLLYLAPEILRSANNVSEEINRCEAADRYAIGVMLLSCYEQLPSVDRVEAAIFRAATGTLVHNLPANQELPVWLARASSHRRTLSLLHRLVAPVPETRLRVNLRTLTQRLEQSVEMADPCKAVAWLRDRGKPEDALGLLEEVLPLTESLGISSQQQYELLCLAGELCGGYLRRPLDALDYLERAVTLQPNARQARQEQLSLIVAAKHHSSLDTSFLTDPGIAVDLDVKLWRNYRALYLGRTIHSDDADEQKVDRLVARYVIWRGQFDIARDFIYPRLFDSSGNYAWWDFDLNLAYVQSFLGLEDGSGVNLDRAAEQTQQIKKGFAWIEQNGMLDPTLLGQYGQELAELELRIFALRSGKKKVEK